MWSEPKLCTQNRISPGLSAHELRRGIFARTWEAKCNWEVVGAGEESELRSGRESCGGQEKKGKTGVVFRCPDLLPEWAGCSFRASGGGAGHGQQHFLPAGRVSYLMVCPLRKWSSSRKCERGSPVGYSPRVVELDLGPRTTVGAYSSIHLGPSTWPSPRGWRGLELALQKTRVVLTT